MSYIKSLFTILKSSFKIIIALLFVGSLAMNIITMTWTTEGIAAKGALAAVASITSVAADLGSKLAASEKVVTGLRGELAANEVMITDLIRDLADSVKEATDLKNRLDANKKAVSRSTKNITRRTIRGVRRSLAAIPADFIPYVGNAITLGVTVWELYDACETMKDMDEIIRSMGINDTVEEDKACKIEIPSKEEIVKVIKSSPGKVLASVSEFGVDIPEDALEDISEDALEDALEDIPEDIPEDIREDAPEDAQEDEREDTGKGGGFFSNSWESARKYFSDD